MANAGPIAIRGAFSGVLIPAQVSNASGFASYYAPSAVTNYTGASATFLGSRYRVLPAKQPLSLDITFSETLNLTEGLVPSVLTSTTVSESLTFSETLDAIRVVPIIVSESMSYTEGLSFSLSMSVSESLNLSESLGASVAYNLTFSETLSYLESLFFQFDVSIPLTHVFTESLIASQTFSVSLPETLTVVESLTPSNHYIFTATVSHFFSESLSSQVAMSVTLPEVVNQTAGVFAFSSGVVTLSPTSLQVTFRTPIREGLVSDPSRYLLIPVVAGQGVPSRITSLQPLRNQVATGVATPVGTDPYTRELNLGYSSAVPGQILTLSGSTQSVLFTILQVVGPVVTLNSPVLVLPSGGPLTWTLYSPVYGVELTHTEMTDGKTYQVRLGPLESIFGGDPYRQETNFIASGELPTVVSALFQPEDASILVTFSESMTTGASDFLNLSGYTLAGLSPARVTSARWVSNTELLLTTWGVDTGIYTLTLPTFKDLAQNTLVQVILPP